MKTFNNILTTSQLSTLGFGRLSSHLYGYCGWFSGSKYVMEGDTEI